VRLQITQFTIRRLMAAVAVAGLVFGCLAWIWRRLALDFHIHDAFIKVGPYVFASDSAAFWAILLLGCSGDTIVPGTPYLIPAMFRGHHT
jgi:hypothetical protein